MALLFSGQKRKSKAALEAVRGAALSAGQLLTLGEFEAARERYDDILRTLKSDDCRQWVSGGLIQEPVWTELTAAALLGRIRAVSSLDGRSAAFKKAEQMMAEVFALKPDWPEAHDYLAGLAIARGDARSAKQYVDNLFAINPRHPRARLLLAIIHFDNGDYKEAGQALAQLPETAESLAYLGRCQLRLQNPETAIKTFERARGRFGVTFDLSYYLGCALAHAGRYEEARQELTAAADLDPQRPEPSVQLGHLCLLSGEVAEAETYYRAALAFGTRAAVPAHYGLALIAAGTGGPFYEAHLDSIRQADETSELLAAARADACERAGKDEQARRFYQAIPARSLLYGAALTRLGFMSFRAGDYVGALDLLRQAASLRPTDDRLLDLLGAAAAVTGEFRLAESIWAQLEARGAADQKTARALDDARMWSTLEAAYQGQAASAIEPLEALHKKSGDAAVADALADAYFIAALEAFEAEPPALDRAQEFLLLGKHLTAHLKFEYALALADLLAGRFEAAAARLRGMLAAHPRNSGAAYHLGVALSATGDRRGAEQAFRQALSLPQKEAARPQRLKWALAVLLFRDQRWGESVAFLNELAPTDEFVVNETPPLIYELMMRGYALMGDWETSERLAIGPGGRQTPLAAIILARRNMKASRMDAALSHLERYLAACEGDEGADRVLIERAKRVVTPLALRTAAQRVREGRYDEARDLLVRAASSMSGSGGAAESWALINEFVKALQERAASPQRVERLAAGYEAMPVESVLEKDDLKTIRVEIPIVLPPKSQRALDQIKRPVFNAARWRADAHPEFLLTFDC